jgi:hypothetical protein
MRSLIALVLLSSAIPTGALAAERSSDSKRQLCAKSAEARSTKRERKPECRAVRVVPALLDPVPLFIL